jgi:hypothetical protein
MMVCSPGGRAPRFALIVARSGEALPADHGRRLMAGHRYWLWIGVPLLIVLGALFVLVRV